MSSKKNNEQLWDCFCKLKENKELLKIFKAAKTPLTVNKNLKTLLLKTEAFLDDFLHIEVEKFSEKLNQNDKTDVVDLKNLTFNAYQRRVGNLLLAQIHNNLKSKTKLKEFIKQSWISTTLPKSLSNLPEFDLGSPFEDDISIPFAMSNASIVDDNFNFKIPSSDDLEISEIKVNEEYKLSLSIARQDLNEAFKEFNRAKEADFQIVVNKIEDDIEERASIGPSTQEKLNDMNWRLGNNVIKELSENNESSNIKVRDLGSIDLSFTAQGSTAKYPSAFKSVEGFLSDIRRVSNSNYSEVEGQKNSIFEFISPLKLKKKEKEMKKRKNEEAKDELDQSEESFSFSEASVLNNEEDVIGFDQAKKPWFSVTIAGKEHMFYKIFKRFSTGELVSLNNLLPVFEKTLKKLKITLFDHYKILFKSIYEGIYSGKLLKNSKKILNIKINFQEFIQIMNLWGEKYQQEQKTVLGSVVRTSGHLNSLQKEFHNFESLSSILDFTLFQIKKTVNDFFSNKIHDQAVEDTQKKNLEDIFAFYGKIQKLQGTEPTFEALETSNTNWNLGKFLKFCLDFQIVSAKHDLKRGASKETLIKLFKSLALNTRVMSFSQFLQALDRISELLYSPELDQKLQTNFAYKSTDEKRFLLYNLLEISNMSKLQLKKKSFGLTYIPEKHIKSSKTDLQINKPIKKPQNDSPNNKLFKPKLINFSKPTPKFLSPQPVSKVNQEIYSSYLSRFKSAAGLKISPFSPRFRQVDSPKVSQKIDMSSFSPKFEQVQSPKASRKFIFTSLANLMNMDLEPNDSLKALIFEDPNENLDQIERRDSNLARIVKIHNLNLARGLKVLNKYR